MTWPADSRAAALPPLALIMVLFLVDRKRHVLLSVLLGIYAAIAFASGFAGRSLAQHGLSTIGGMFSNVASMDSQDLISVLVTNAFEGFFNIAEGFMLVPAYPNIYKVLSVSPLPSFIDGFDRIREMYEVRLHTYVPLPGYMEALLFGPVFFSCLLGIFLLSIRLVFSIRSANTLAFFIANIILFPRLLQ